MSSLLHRMMCSCGSRILLSVRNGYVKISSLGLTQLRSDEGVFIMTCWFPSSGHQRPDQQGVLHHARHPPWQARYISVIHVLWTLILGCSCCISVLRFSLWGWTNKDVTYKYILMLTSPSLALWILAAKSEMEDRNSSESARHLFLRALRFHPNDKKVYQEVREAEMFIFSSTAGTFTGYQ